MVCTSNKKQIFLIAILCSFVFIFFVGTAQAQGIEVSTTLNINPQFPGPNENVEISVQSSEIDLSRAKVEWYLNGELRKSGFGDESVFLRTESVDNVYTIRAVIETGAGDVVSRTTTIRPLGLDVLWNANTYTPPFYSGKALSSSASVITITAIPDFVDKQSRKLKTKDLVYTWSVRGIVLGNSSGLGKHSIRLENKSVLQDSLVVTVTVTDFNNTVSTQKTISIPVSQSVVGVYEKHPLLGVLSNKSLETGVQIENEEITLRAEPYYFSLDDIARGLVRFRWKINNLDVPTPVSEQRQEMTFRKDGSSGKSIISVGAENWNIPFRVLQEAYKDIMISF